MKASRFAAGAVLAAAGILSSQIANASAAITPMDSTSPRALASYAGECKAVDLYGADRLRVPSLSYADRNNLNCWLDYGSTGDGVSALQQALRSCYGRAIAVDGSFGSATRTALIYAQGQEGISQDGGYGTQSRQSLKFSYTNEVTDVSYCGHRL